MSLVAVLTFAAVFVIACASPGPVITALIARVVGKGTNGVAFFCAGLVLSDMVWLSCAAFGLAAAAALFQPVFLAIKYLGAAYLLFLAWKLWTAPTQAPAAAEPIRGDGARLLFGGLALGLGNPKAMLFYLAILPTVVTLSDLGSFGFAELAIMVIAMYSAVLCFYVLLAARMRRLFKSARAVRVMNRATGTVMAGAAVAVATRAG